MPPVAVRDYRALHLATLDMLARCPTCRCGAVATVVDHAAKRDSCDACHTGNATDRPWAGLARDDRRDDAAGVKP